MIARAAGLVLLAIVREVGAAGCPIIPPVGSPIPYQTSVYEAVSAGVSHEDVTLPAKLDGFNRTVSIEGLCDNAVTTSSSFTCQSGGGEFHAGLTAPVSPVTLTFGLATCQMTGISIYKTDGHQDDGFKAMLRLQFDGCMGSPTGVTNAAVVVGITKDPVKDMNLLKWSREVCKSAVTTTFAPAAVSQQTDALVTPVGAGTCEATERRKIEDIKTEDNCKVECMGSATAAQILGGVGCKGFAFNSGASGATCITYSGSVTKAIPDAGWKCFNLSTSVDQMTYGKSTPAPATVLEDVPQELYVEQALGQSGMAYLHEISPPKDSPDCFKPMWWFKLEDREGKPLSVSVKDADWDDFMSDARFPTEEKTKSVVSAPMVLDRVLFNTCTKSTKYSEQTCFVAPVEKTQCRSEELTGAVISGVFTAILTWIFVGVFFKCCSMRQNRNVRGEYTKLDGPVEGTKSEAVCDACTVATLSLVALSGAVGCCGASMWFLNAVLRSADCYDFDELLIVILCVAISAWLGVSCILWHMAQFRHTHPMVRDAGSKPAVQSGSHLMLVDV